MLRRPVPFLITLLAALLIPSLALAERAIKVQPKRLALVIGNGSYKSSPLKNPPNDVYDMAAQLKKLGFEVMHYANKFLIVCF